MTMATSCSDALLLPGGLHLGVLGVAEAIREIDSAAGSGKIARQLSGICCWSRQGERLPHAHPQGVRGHVVVEGNHGNSSSQTQKWP